MGLLSKIFTKKEPLVPFTLSNLKVDIHSHLIPGIDDGSDDMETSLLLARGFVDLGYKKVITTPHVMSDFYQNSPAIIKSGLQALNVELLRNNIDLEISAAAEYYVDFEFVEKIGKEELLTFGDNYILIECSFIEPPKLLSECIFKLQTNGYKPVLAHPERYVYWHYDLKQYDDLKNRDVQFQLNILSLAGRYTPEIAAMGEFLVKENMIDWLGTDMHNENQLYSLRGLHLKESVVQKLQSTIFKNSELLK